MKAIDIFNVKWGIIDDPNNSYSVQENFLLKNGKIVDIGIIINDRCVAFGMYFPILEVTDKSDSRDYFHKYVMEYHQSEIDFAFYFDNDSLIVNDLRYVYPYDELLNDFGDLHKKIKDRYKL
jgi:hypothetical protein